MNRWSSTGTHKGEFMGIPATGKKIKVDVVSISLFVGDKVVESWDYVDMLGMMQQMGAIPPMGEGGK